MALTEQLEPHLRQMLFAKRGEHALSGKEAKVRQHRIERRRAKRDPECLPCYRKYRGYEY